MAVAYVSHIEGASSGAGATFTLSSVVGGGGGASDRVCWAAFAWQANGGQTITGVTFDGNAMTQIGTELGNGGGRSVATYRYINPTTTGNVVATFSASVDRACGAAIVFSGVDQTTPFGTSQTSTPASSPTTTSAVTSAVDGMCVDATMSQGVNVASYVPDAGQTGRASQVTDDGAIHFRASTEPGAASVTMGWTWTGGIGSVHRATPIAAAAAASSAVVKMMAHNEC